MYRCRKLTRKEICSVYELHMRYDFPKNELKPLSMILEGLDKETYFCFGIFKEDELLGYAYFISQLIDGMQCCLLDYFAVVRGMRDKGIGSEFLSLLRNELTFADLVVCESEDPAFSAGDDLNTRQKRIAFYQRNHFSDTGVRACVFGVDYVVMEFDQGSTHSAEEVRQCYKRIYKAFLPEERYKKHVRVKQA